MRFSLRPARRKHYGPNRLQLLSVGWHGPEAYIYMFISLVEDASSTPDMT